MSGTSRRPTIPATSPVSSAPIMADSPLVRSRRRSRVSWTTHVSQISTVGHRLLAGHHGDGFALEVDVGFAADVDRDPGDRAAGESERRRAGVILGHGVGAVASDAEAVAAERELARLRLDQ